MRDKVDMLAGFDLTPNALAAADVSAQAKKFMVNMNAATSIITTKSPYMVRTSFTVPQVNEALGTWAYKSGVRKAYTLVSDFSPGHDGEAGVPAAASRRPAARSSARRAIRWRTSTSPRSCSAPRTSNPDVHLHLGAGRPAARGDRQGRSPSAASTRTRSRSWARAN